MKRRELITLLGGAAVGWPLAARAQQTERVRRVGVLMLYPESDPQGQLRATAFRQVLEKLGWTVGRDVQIDFRWGLGDTDWIRSAAAQLLQLAPDVILANGDAATRVVQQSTRTVPIIFIAGSDPVAEGLVQSLAHPGGNLTGFLVLEPSLGAKLVELLKEIARVSPGLPSCLTRTIPAISDLPLGRRPPLQSLPSTWRRLHFATPPRSARR
jgi:putative tryptophan/tyrosine transport system substrate-binding protein